MSTEKRGHESKSRANARRIIQNSVGASQWSLNAHTTKQLEQQLLAHPLLQHPIISHMSAGAVGLELQRMAHLEFASAFSQPFTDLLLSAMLDTSELRQPQGPKAQMAARFLIGLNLLEELGFTLDPETDNDLSTPENSHYLQLLKTVKALGISDDERDAYQASPATLHIRSLMDNTKGDLLAELICLVVTESIFPIFSNLWAESVENSGGIDINEGFHAIHVDDEDGANIEDDHGGDAWHLLIQVLTPDRAAEAEAHMNAWLNAITAFLDGIAAQVPSPSLVAAQ